MDTVNVIAKYKKCYQGKMHQESMHLNIFGCAKWDFWNILYGPERLNIQRIIDNIHK